MKEIQSNITNIVKKKTGKEVDLFTNPVVENISKLAN